MIIRNPSDVAVGTPVRHSPMSSKVHQLYPTAALATPRPAEPAPLVAELRSLFSGSALELTERMFREADDLLFEMSERAGSNNEQRLYFDTMRVLRLERPAISATFEHTLAQCFEPGYEPDASRQMGSEEIDFDSLALRDNDSLEQAIALVNIETRAESQFRQPLWEIERRLGWLNRNQGLPIAPNALAPVGLCNALRSALEPIDVGVEVKLVVFKLFERQVVDRLGPVYGQLLKWLDDHGIKPALSGRVAAQGARAVRPGVPGQAAQPGLGSEPRPAPVGPGSAPGFLSQNPAQLPTRPGSTSGPFQGAQVSAPPAALYTDAMLAQQLHVAAQGQRVPGLAQGSARAALQRVQLVGEMFDGILNDRQIPGALKPLLESLRFPAIKASIKDPAFFTDSAHPLRSLINEISELAAASGATGGSGAASLEPLVEALRLQFDIDPRSLRPALDGAQPVDSGSVERFLQQQAEAGQKRRQAILDKARQVVAQELAVGTFGAQLPEATGRLLQSGWAPMMGLTLFRNGIESLAWHSGLDLLDRTVRSVAPLTRVSPEDLDDLLADYRQGLRRIGMAEDRVAALLDGLRGDIWTQPLEPAPSLEVALGVADVTDVAEEAPQPVPVSRPVAGPRQSPADAVPSVRQILDMLLRPGAWFRVYDPGNGDTRWLKVTVYAGDHRRVAFAEFDGNNSLTLDTDAFFDHLLVRRSEPIDPTPAAHAGLERLIAHRALSAPSGPGRTGEDGV